MIKILNSANKVCIEFRVDKLDCSISWARQSIDMSYKEVMKKFDLRSHFVVIYRRGFIKEEYIGEIGFCTMGAATSYYLWIYLSKEDLDKLVLEYKLSIKK